MLQKNKALRALLRTPSARIDLPPADANQALVKLIDAAAADSAAREATGQYPIDRMVEALDNLDVNSAAYNDLISRYPDIDKVLRIAEAADTDRRVAAELLNELVGQVMKDFQDFPIVQPVPGTAQRPKRYRKHMSRMAWLMVFMRLG